MDKKLILVQGAGRGLGLALVHQVLQDNVACVCATARDPRAADGLMELQSEYGEDRLMLLPLDLAEEDSIAEARRAVGAQYDRLDLMITCAGLLHDDQGLWPEKQLADIKPENLAKSFVINATGPVLMIKHFHDLLTHGERAVIASLSARVGSISDNGFGGWYAYRASKAAQNQFTKTASIELKRKSQALICVGLHPGTVNTGLSEPFQKRVPAKQLQTPEQAAKHLLGVIAQLSPDDSGQLFDWAGKRIQP
ncbi:MAG: SDR family oxidoreductase [Salinisphaera sp.]|jgi:NAD(P)-dependent dehydrogenase (short-subunit alcohol dehydrogenase family)|nr:SDR family oxidoreductase [Salinisphaera sp.]